MPEPQKADLSTTGAVPSTTLPTEGFASATEVQTDTPAKATETTEADATSAVAKREIFLEALESSWLEVKDGKGVILFTSILKQGQKLPIPDQNDITVTTGNAGGLRLLLNDKIVAPLGQANEVKRNIPLDRLLSSQN
jgi:cytoskeleton protein RodZ